jgi:hypothetical protein
MMDLHLKIKTLTQVLWNNKDSLLLLTSFPEAELVEFQKISADLPKSSEISKLHFLRTKTANEHGRKGVWVNEHGKSFLLLLLFNLK